MIPPAMEIALSALLADASFVAGGFLSGFVGIRALLHLRKAVLDQDTKIRERLGS